MQLHKLFTAVAALALQADAATIKIVGAPNLTFTPNTITASVGDVLEFHFLPRNHSVARGDFANPCRPASAGFFSGYNFFTTAGEAGKVFRVPVVDTQPLAFYCTQGNHCVSGMVGVVNGAGQNTYAAYHAASMASGLIPAVAPASVGGGDAVDNPTAATTTSPSTTAPAPTQTTVAPGAAGLLQVSLAGVLGAVGLAIAMM